MNGEEKRLTILLRELAGAVALMEASSINFTNEIYLRCINALTDFFIEVNEEAFCLGDNAKRFPLLVLEFCMSARSYYKEAGEEYFDEDLIYWVDKKGICFHNFYKRLKGENNE